MLLALLGAVAWAAVWWQSTAPISVEILGPDRRPVPGATVQYIRSDIAGRFASVTCDDAGFASVPRLPRGGTYELRVRGSREGMACSRILNDWTPDAGAALVLEPGELWIRIPGVRPAYTTPSQ